MGRRGDLIASACLLAFALITLAVDLSFGLEPALAQTYVFWGTIALIAAFLFVWSWKKPVRTFRLRNRDFALLAIVVLLGSVSFEITGAYFALKTPYQQSTPTFWTGSFSITSANFSSSLSRLSIIIKNTGTLNLVSVLLRVDPGSPSYTVSWNPTLSDPYGINQGESVKGLYLFGTSYRQGLQVTIYVTATFSDGSQSSTTDILVVGQ